MAVKSLTVIRAFYSKLIFMCYLVLESSKTVTQEK